VPAPCPEARRRPVILGGKPATRAEWDAVVDASPCATFFHTREWAEIWQHYSDGALVPAARMVKFDDGVVALLPAVEKSMFDLQHVGRLSPALRTVISSCGSTFGGWISAGPLTAEHHLALWEHTRRLNVDLTENPYDPAMADAGLPWTEEGFTQVLDLAPGYDAVRRSWSRGHISAVNKATRAGLGVVRASTIAQWRDYVRVYGLSMERWGTPAFVYTGDLFERLALSESGKVRLWVVELEGRVIAGVICLYQGSTVMYWHGAFDIAHQHLRAAPLLHAEIMRQAIDEGYRWYDFNPSGGDEGVLTFKSRFGTERRPVRRLVSDARFKRALHRARSALRG
jgi:Acetyltransferase (GNAT) domain